MKTTARVTVTAPISATLAFSGTANLMVSKLADQIRVAQPPAVADLSAPKQAILCDRFKLLEQLRMSAQE